VQRLISDLAEDGLGVLMIDSEPEEMVEGSDRVVVLRDGTVAGTFSGEELTEQNLVRMIAGSEGSEARESGEDADG
jgi:monosaccharide-transporting ATPase